MIPAQGGLAGSSPCRVVLRYRQVAGREGVIQMSWIEVLPAYGRDYKNQRDALADWNANKDFIETSRRVATSKSDCERMGLKVVIRYDRMTKVVSTSK